MSHPPKLLRSHVRGPVGDPGSFIFEDRWALPRRPARLFELEFPYTASPPGSRATLGAMVHPAHGSSVAALTFGDRLALAVAAAANGWVIERFVVDENDFDGRTPTGGHHVRSR